MYFGTLIASPRYLSTIMALPIKNCLHFSVEFLYLSKSGAKSSIVKMLFWVLLKLTYLLCSPLRKLLPRYTSFLRRLRIPLIHETLHSMISYDVVAYE